MYKNILIATDGSELADTAVKHGLALAKALNAKATAVTVTEPWTNMVSSEMTVSFPIEEYEKGCTESAAKILGGVADVAKAVGVDCDTLHVKDSFPSDGIIETAKKRDCDLIVMASHGRRGISRMLMGSQANKVVTLSSKPVLVCR